jgi:hypothetical protein
LRGAQERSLAATLRRKQQNANAKTDAARTLRQLAHFERKRAVLERLLHRAAAARGAWLRQREARHARCAATATRAAPPEAAEVAARASGAAVAELARQRREVLTRHDARAEGRQLCKRRRLALCFDERVTRRVAPAGRPAAAAVLDQQVRGAHLVRHRERSAAF